MRAIGKYQFVLKLGLAKCVILNTDRGNESGQRSEIDASAVSWRSTTARVTKNRGGATCVGAWSNFILVTLWSASFCMHLPKMDTHEERWPRHLHLVHLVLPTVHLLCRSRSQRRAGAPAPIAAPRWQGGLRRVYQHRLARRKLLSSARVEVPNVLRALLRAHRLLAAEIFRVRSRSGALQPTFRARELKERRARPRKSSCHVCYGRRRRQLMS